MPFAKDREHARPRLRGSQELLDPEGLAEGVVLARDPLRWEPFASGRRGDYGFTLGRYVLGASHGSYATIWHRRPDGTWKVAFDIGRPSS